MYEVGAGMSVGKLAPKHDLRKGEIPNNVDPDRIKDNVILIDELKGRTIEEWTNDELQPVIDEYNAKQKRPDRKVNRTYTEWHKQNGLYTQNKNIKGEQDIKFAYEFVLSYGGHDDIGGEYYNPNTPEKRKREIYNQAVRLFTKWTNDFKESYPHLKIALAVIHADEPNGAIHLHGIVQPRAEYNRSLKTQVCISKALHQDGIEKITDKDLAKDAGGFQLARLYKDFRTHMEEDLKREQEPGDDGDFVNCFTIKKEEHGKEHMTKNAYTEKMKEAEERIETARQLETFTDRLKEIDEHKTKVFNYDGNKIKKKTKLNGEKVVELPETIYDSLTSSTQIEKIRSDVEWIQSRQKTLCEQTINAISSGREKELEAKIESLERECRSKDIEISKLKSAIETLKENVRSFVRENALVKTWQKFIEKIREEREITR